MNSPHPCGHGQTINNTVELNTGYCFPVPLEIQKIKLYHPRDLLNVIKKPDKIEYELKTMIEDSTIEEITEKVYEKGQFCDVDCDDESLLDEEGFCKVHDKYAKRPENDKKSQKDTSFDDDIPEKIIKPVETEKKVYKPISGQFCDLDCTKNCKNYCKS